MVLVIIGAQKFCKLIILRDIYVELYIIRFHPCDLAFLYLMFCVAINWADGLGLGLGLGLDVPPCRRVVTEIVF